MDGKLAGKLKLFETSAKEMARFDWEQETGVLNVARQFRRTIKRMNA